MTRFVVATSFRWDEYPGLRPGRIFAGSGDVAKSPMGESHLVAGAEVARTLCGRPRVDYPQSFPDRTELVPSEICTPCPNCLAAAV